MKKRQRRRSAWMLAGVGATAAAALLGACNLEASGSEPPPGKLAYPIALALSPEPRPSTLYVANSNFDLSYSAGSVQAYDLAQLDGLFEDCRSIKERDELDASIEVPDYASPLDAGTLLDASLEAGTGDAGPDDAGVEAPALDAATSGPIVLPADYDAPMKEASLPGALCDNRSHGDYDKCCLTAGDPALDAARTGERLIDSFATGLAVSPHGGRLYLPISSRSRLTYIDVDQGRLSCPDDQERCTSGPGIGREDMVPEHDFPGQPSAMAQGTLGDLGLAEALNKPAETPFIATAHELGGVAFFTESGPFLESGAVSDESVPVLEDVVLNRFTRPTSLTIDPRHKLLYLTLSAASEANSAIIRRFGVRVDEDPVPGEGPPRELLYETSGIQPVGVAEARDLRDVAIDPRDPNRLFVLVRGSQESVLFMRLDNSTLAQARLTDVVRVGAGPGKLEYIETDGRGFLLVSCYDERTIYIIDAATAKLTALVRNLSGPYDMAFDAARKLLYVADFRTSVLRVVDLAGLADESKPDPVIILTIGALKFEGRIQ